MPRRACCSRQCRPRASAGQRPSCASPDWVRGGTPASPTRPRTWAAGWRAPSRADSPRRRSRGPSRATSSPTRTENPGALRSSAARARSGPALPGRAHRLSRPIARRRGRRQRGGGAGGGGAQLRPWLRFVAPGLDPRQQRARRIGGLGRDRPLSEQMPYHHPVHASNAHEDFSSIRDEFLAAPLTYQLLLRMCRGARMAGCYALLMDGDARAFSRSLQVSGRAFAHFLPQIPAEQRITSRAAPLLDALACGDRDGAAAIARGLTAPWARDAEYEEDFLFFRFLFALLGGPAGEDGAPALLATYEKVIDGGDAARLDAAWALLT